MDEVVALIDALEGEVNNGGFHQYFYNSAGDRTAETIQALEIIGALAVADIVKRAAQKFRYGMPPKNRLLLAAYPNAAAFRELDEEFYQYPDNLSALITKYKSSV
jgi:YD repeat-containing protein